MSWNYRVMESVGADGEAFYDIREVYYSKAGQPNGYTEHAARVGSENVAGLVWVLDRMREAIDKPILKESDCSHPNQEAD